MSITFRAEKLNEHIDTIVSQISQQRVLLAGEDHIQPAILDMQLELIKGLYKNNPNLVIGLEMFNTEQQALLDDYLDGHISLSILEEKYSTSAEGFPIPHYGKILMLAKKLDIPIKGLIIPRTIAAKVVRSGLSVLEEEDCFLKPKEVIQGNNDYKTIFSALINSSAPMMKTGFNIDRFFLAQVVKDSAMAKSIVEVLTDNTESWVIAIMGKGHMEYGFGVTERIPIYLKKKRINIDPVTLTVRDLSEPVTKIDKLAGRPPAKYIALYTRLE